MTKPHPSTGPTTHQPTLNPAPATFPKRLWHSPTLTSWASLAVKVLNVAVVLLLVLRYFRKEEVAVWQLFLTVINLQFMFDFGFVVTFARFIAYAMGGAVSVGDVHTHPPPPTATDSGQPNWPLVESIVATMRVTYRRLALGLVALSLGLITPALAAPISTLPDPGPAWAAWGVIVATTAFCFYGLSYASYLQGVEQIAPWRRGEVIAGLAAAGSCVATLLLGGSILELIVARQTCYVCNVLYNRYLCGRVHGARWRGFARNRIDPHVFGHVWSRSWRTGLGLLASLGLVHASGLLYAQWAPPGAVASYLLAMRVMDTVGMFSQTPFYTKLPTLARLQSQRKNHDQAKIVRKNMTWAYWLFVVGMLAAAYAAQPIFNWIASDTKWVSTSLWTVICVMAFIQRHDWMLLQYYSLTNHIIWHRVNGVSCLVALGFTAALGPSLGIIAFPLGVLLGHLSYFTWEVSRRSYRAFGLDGLRFELQTSATPFVVLTAGLGLYLWLYP